MSLQNATLTVRLVHSTGAPVNFDKYFMILSSPHHYFQSLVT